jgi:hypothetical protein
VKKWGGAPLDNVRVEKIKDGCTPDQAVVHYARSVMSKVVSALNERRLRNRDLREKSLKCRKMVDKNRMR